MAPKKLDPPTWPVSARTSFDKGSPLCDDDEIVHATTISHHYSTNITHCGWYCAVKEDVEETIHGYYITHDVRVTCLTCLSVLGS